MSPLATAFLPLLVFAFAVDARAQAETTEPSPATTAPAPDPAAQAADPAPAAVPEPASDPPPAAEVTPPPAPTTGLPDLTAGLPLWNDTHLHGRFDLNFERVGYSGNYSEGRSRFQNYHHLLFLIRESQNDPITFNLEIIEQRWYEIAYRVAPKDSPWRVLAKAGKVLMPFGSDPLYHHMYGGRAGFDQTLLPVIWAQLGATVNVQYKWDHVRLSNDTYVVQGYRLARADAVLNLQSDFSSTDDMRLGVGDRIALAYGPFTAYYSAYYNTLGFGRRLFMQAFDLSLGRLRGVPVLQNITVDIGVVRADVSGGAQRGFGGHNDDYYHFADYLMIRYYITEWLYVQGRTGIKTIANRRGLYIDGRSLDQSDTTSHNLGIVGRYRGLSGGIYQFWDLERRNEVPNDMTRFAVIYEF